MDERARYISNAVAMAFIAQALSTAGQVVALQTRDECLWIIATRGWARASGIYWTLAIMAAADG